MAYRNQNICRMQRSPRLMRPDSGHNQAILAPGQQVALDSLLNMCEIVIDYIMSQYPSPPPSSGDKRDRLQRSGTLNPHPERVRDSAFQVEGFFDPLDLLQVRYEMVRLVRLGKATLAEAASRFGVSRPTCFRASKAFAESGLQGLVPAARGPRGPHKVTEEILGFVEDYRAEHGPAGARKLVPLIAERFDVHLHPRGLEKALARASKKSREPRT